MSRPERPAVLLSFGEGEVESLAGVQKCLVLVCVEVEVARPGAPDGANVSV